MKQGYHETKLSILCLIVALAGSFQMSHAENLISDYVIQGVGVYPSTHVFTDPAPLRFSLNDISMQGEWSFSLLMNDDTYMDAAFTPVESGICEFRPLEIPSSRWKWETKPIFDDSLNRDIFMLRVSFTSEDGTTDSEDIRLGLSPARPVINEISYTYTYNWELNCIELGACFSFKVKADGSDKFVLHFSDPFLYEPPYLIRFSRDYKGQNEVVINHDADWGEFIFVTATNHFGYEDSEILCSTNFITDQAILARIAEIKDMETGVGEVGYYKPDSYRWDGSVLTFPDIVSSVNVVDMGGREILSASDVESLNLSSFANGIYMVVYKFENQKNGVVNRIKIMKK